MIKSSSFYDILPSYMTVWLWLWHISCFVIFVTIIYNITLYYLAKFKKENKKSKL